MFTDREIQSMKALARMRDAFHSHLRIPYIKSMFEKGEEIHPEVEDAMKQIYLALDMYKDDVRAEIDLGVRMSGINHRFLLPPFVRVKEHHLKTVQILRDKGEA